MKKNLLGLRFKTMGLIGILIQLPSGSPQLIIPLSQVSELV